MISVNGVVRGEIAAGSIESGYVTCLLETNASFTKMLSFTFPLPTCESGSMVTHSEADTFPQHSGRVMKHRKFTSPQFNLKTLHRWALRQHKAI